MSICGWCLSTMSIFAKLQVEHDESDALHKSYCLISSFCDATKCDRCSHSTLLRIKSNLKHAKDVYRFTLRPGTSNLHHYSSCWHTNPPHGLQQPYWWHSRSFAVRPLGHDFASVWRDGMCNCISGWSPQVTIIQPNIPKYRSPIAGACDSTRYSQPNP